MILALAPFDPRVLRGVLVGHKTANEHTTNVDDLRSPSVVVASDGVYTRCTQPLDDSVVARNDYINGEHAAFLALRHGDQGPPRDCGHAQYRVAPIASVSTRNNAAADHVCLSLANERIRLSWSLAEFLSRVVQCQLGLI